MLSGFTSFVVSNSWVRNNFPEFPKQQNSLKNVTVVITYQTLPMIYHFFKFSLYYYQNYEKSNSSRWWVRMVG